MRVCLILCLGLGLWLGAAAGPAEALNYQVVYQDDGFHPPILTARVGDEIRIENQTSANLQLTSAPESNHVNKNKFDVGLIPPGRAYLVGVSATGVHIFYNQLKPQHYGRISVARPQRGRPIVIGTDATASPSGQAPPAESEADQITMIAEYFNTPTPEIIRPEIPAVQTRPDQPPGPVSAGTGQKLWFWGLSGISLLVTLMALKLLFADLKETKDENRFTYGRSDGPPPAQAKKHH